MGGTGIAPGVGAAAACATAVRLVGAGVARWAGSICTTLRGAPHAAVSKTAHSRTSRWRGRSIVSEVYAPRRERVCHWLTEGSRLG
jgi:hypothetical protein